MKLRDIAGNPIYPETIDNNGKDIKDTLDNIYAKLDKIRTNISSFNSQTQTINTVKSQISTINDDIGYLSEWTDGDADTLTVVCDQSSNPLINIIGGGYWTRAAVTYINIIIRCNFEWDSSQRICLGFPLPTNNVALSTFGPYYRSAIIDTSGYLIIGPKTVDLQAASLNSDVSPLYAESSTYYISGTYANKIS